MCVSVIEQKPDIVKNWIFALLLGSVLDSVDIEVGCKTSRVNKNS